MPYLIGLLSWLGAGAVLFVIIVLLRSPGGSAEGESGEAARRGTADRAGADGWASSQVEAPRAPRS